MIRRRAPRSKEEPVPGDEWGPYGRGRDLRGDSSPLETN